MNTCGFLRYVFTKGDMIKIGAITVGQSPRWDISKDVMDVLGDEFQIIEAGVWDGVTREEIEQKYGPEEGKDVMPTKLKDGSTIAYAEYHCFPRIQSCVEKLEAQGVSLIYMYCAGSFPEMKTKVPLIYPRNITVSIVQALLVNSSMIEIMPSGDIYEQQKRFWGEYVKNLKLMVADPFSENVWEGLEKAADQANNSDADLIFLDCMGYNVEHMKFLKERTEKKVLLPRTAVAAIIKELLRTR